VKSGRRRLRDLTLIVLAMGLVEAVFAGALMVAFEGDRITARQMVVTAFELGAAIALPLQALVLLVTGVAAAWRRLHVRSSRCRYCGDRIERGLEACSVCDFFVQIRKVA
jgi:hypothetical protein